jgi:hypothetical protein
MLLRRCLSAERNVRADTPSPAAVADLPDPTYTDTTASADSESKRICEVKRLLARFAVDIICHPRSWSKTRIRS